MQLGRWDIGRVSAIQSSRVRIEYFESIAEPIAETVDALVQDCQPVMLPVGARVFWCDPDTHDWTAGRVTARQGESYFVRFPNSGEDRRVSGSDLRVRWNRPVQDPLHVLTAGGSEPWFFRQARMPMLNALVRQRAACANVPAFLSSAVELFPHQVQASLTVLSDPVQRYLLADEVGLGKTVEAGFVVRQTLIDNPLAKITILAPDVLRRQWIRELTGKFFTDDFPRAEIRVVAHENPTGWAKHKNSDLLVVDEAHALVQGGDPNSSPYRELAPLAHTAERLLLLSATPITSNLITHLGLLHLLDPDVYRWEDRAAFEARYALRAELADVVYAIDADWPPLLSMNIDRVRAVLPEDKRVEELGAAVLSLLTLDGDLADIADEDELKLRVDELRGHISETYRLHRRTIRHRRSQVLADRADSDFVPYEVRGRELPRRLTIESPADERIQEILEEWRTGTRSALLDMGIEDEDASYAQVYGILMSRSGVSGRDLLEILRLRVEHVEPSIDLDPVDRGLLTFPPVLAHEPDILCAVEEAVAESGVIAFEPVTKALLSVLPQHRKMIAFCGGGALADDLAAHLRARFPKAPMFRHTRSMAAEDAEESVTSWRDAASGLLVCDDSGEDGLNLQVADAAIHLRLPWSPNRLEQRLGRVDRFVESGRNTPHGPAVHYVVLPLDGELAATTSWLELLCRGYRIFDTSVSTLQDAISQGLGFVWRRALDVGPDGLVDCAEQVERALKEASIEIDKMDMLESIHHSVTYSDDVANAMSELETDWHKIRDAVLGYTSDKNGGINIRRLERSIDGRRVEVFDIAGSKPRVDPSILRVARSRFGEDSGKGVFNRSVAVQPPGRRIFRIGNPVVDLLAHVIDNDDRGQATCVVRIDPRRQEEEPGIYFGFDFLVEADLRAAIACVPDAPSAVPALRRRADRLFAPFTMRVWVEAEEDCAVADPEATRWLERPLDPRRDHDITGRKLDELIGLLGGWAGFRKTGVEAQHLARVHLAETAKLTELSAAALGRAKAGLRVMQAQAKARALAGRLVNDEETMVLDNALTSALADGVSDPSARVVAAMCVVRTGIPGQARGF
ncbi:DEAD/DEAH box helicase [Lentzea sp. NEAU-D13]|uniref:DEAD/DEAH box helicase n=1 Tax=Lentzea alba TaxID=2714351 RepID=A0A7C9RPS4_9PSEU|nr:protein DpdE [Lentzea alba]NGY60391.1 DEAD/DEAH box helicase [Lentzea alba]